MADILSQDEIDILLEITVGDEEWPLIFYIGGKQKLLEVTKQMSIDEYGFSKDHLYSNAIKKRLATEYDVDPTDIETLPSKTATAAFFQKKLQVLKNLEMEKEFITGWLYDNPEYIL